MLFDGKMVAGIPNYLTYFGRDTIWALRMLEPVLAPRVYEMILQTVLDRMSEKGEVAHEEEIACQAAYLRLPQLIKIFESEPEHGKINLSDDDITSVAGILKELSNAIYNYKMQDDDFMAAILFKEYLLRKDISTEQKKKFMLTKNPKGISNWDLMQANFNLILGNTGDYVEAYPDDVREMIPKLIRIKPEDMVGNWRDSNNGLGRGPYPFDVNCIWGPASIRAIRDIMTSKVFREISPGISPERAVLKDYYKNPKKLAQHLKCWEGAKKHFKIHLKTEKIRERLDNYLTNNAEISEKERAALLKVVIEPKISNITVKNFLRDGKIPDSLKDGLTFYALSLDAKGKPVEVMNLDIAFSMFNQDLTPEEIREIIKTVCLPYPLGLLSQGGDVVSNPVFSLDPEHWRTLGRKAYHGTVIWGWMQVILELGLLRQLEQYLRQGDKKEVALLWDAFATVWQAHNSVGKLKKQEYWMLAVEDGEFKPVAVAEVKKTEEIANTEQVQSAARMSVYMKLKQLEADYGRLEDNYVKKKLLPGGPEKFCSLPVCQWVVNVLAGIIRRWPGSTTEQLQLQEQMLTALIRELRNSEKDLALLEDCIRFMNCLTPAATFTAGTINGKVFTLPKMLRENGMKKEYGLLLDYFHKFPEAVSVNEDREDIIPPRLRRSVLQAI